jgi:hypothetical protein
MTYLFGVLCEQTKPLLLLSLHSVDQDYLNWRKIVEKRNKTVHAQKVEFCDQGMSCMTSFLMTVTTWYYANHTYSLAFFLLLHALWTIRQWLHHQFRTHSGCIYYSGWNERNFDGYPTLLNVFYGPRNSVYFSNVGSGPIYWSVQKKTQYYLRFTRNNHFKNNRILYVIINRHGRWGDIVGLASKRTESWTTHVYSRLGINSTFVSNVALSWDCFLWPMYVIRCSSRMVMLWTLQWDAENKKYINVLSFAD